MPTVEDFVAVGNPLEEKLTADGVWRDEMTKRFQQLKRLDCRPIVRDMGEEEKPADAPPS